MVIIMIKKLEKLIETLSVKQQEDLYSELAPRYKRMTVKLYNANGEPDKAGLVRLMERQYNSIREQNGYEFLTKAIAKLHNYIEFVILNVDVRDGYKQKLRQLQKGTHYKILTEGWVWSECKRYARVELKKDFDDDIDNKLSSFLDQ